MANNLSLTSMNLTSIAISLNDLSKEKVQETKKHQDFFNTLFCDPNVDPDETITLSELVKDNFLSDFISALETFRDTYASSNSIENKNLNPIEKAILSIASQENVATDISSINLNNSKARDIESSSHF